MTVVRMCATPGCSNRKPADRELCGDCNYQAVLAEFNQAALKTVVLRNAADDLLAACKAAVKPLTTLRMYAVAEADDKWHAELTAVPKQLEAAIAKAEREPD
jgi:hypothetical protein